MKLQVYFDGACEPRNPGGTMGFGFVIYQDERAIWRHGGISVPEQWGGQTTSNLAEYLALCVALRWLLDSGVCDADIEVCGDSQLVIKQMFGAWRIKRGPYVRAAREAKLLLAKFPNITGRWIPREENAVADALSKSNLAAGRTKC